MKSVTEFPNFILIQGLKAKEALVTEGKTPEEIQASLGTTFKYEGDKLKFFVTSLDVAAQNLEHLKRVLVQSYAEGENTPAKATKIEEHHYVPEFLIESRNVRPQKPDPKGRGKGGRGGGGSGKKKESPWGLSPEEKAAKKAAKPS